MGQVYLCISFRRAAVARYDMYHDKMIHVKAVSYRYTE